MEGHGNGLPLALPPWSSSERGWLSFALGCWLVLQVINVPSPSLMMSLKCNAPYSGLKKTVQVWEDTGRGSVSRH
jgi:hypothetical protein